ncbi:TonB-dependent receptor [Phenylobacterium koreense]|uniref:Outer membrane receptor protein involved in Fe transport n=1 Tax=Phenylobacterium koreense TaxID=266125 RepID=A0ABV2EMS1_9CAUL
MEVSRLVLAASLAAALHPVGALAQEASHVEELVVTGEKTERSLQDTVTSAAVVTARRIDQENIQSFFDIANRTANVTESFGGAGFTIRGISNRGVSGGGNGGVVTVYVDGAPIPDDALRNGPLDTFDVAQVEILRGPQSTLQGRNALAGSVIIRTQDPTWTWSGIARALVSDEDERTFSIAGGGPIVADQLAFRLAYQDRDADGFIRNTTLDRQEDPTRAKTLRGKLLFTPSVLPGLTVRAGVTHDERKGGYLYTYARTDTPDAADTRVSLGDFPTDADNTTDLISVTADYKFDNNFTLSSATAWSKVDSLMRYDTDGTAQPLEFGTIDQVDQSFTQELRLAYDGERLSGLVGAYYADRDRDYGLTSRANVPTPRSTIVAQLMALGLGSAQANQIATVYVAALPAVAIDFNGQAPDEVKTAAIFADGRYRLTPQLSLLAGFRYDHEEYTQSVDQTSVFGGAYPNPAAFGPLAPAIARLNQAVAMSVAQANATVAPASRDFDAFLPKLGVKYDFTDDASLAFVVQRGYRSGGSSINVARSDVVAFDPEYTWNYELALRTAWLADTLTVNANAYYVDWKDQQVSVNLGTSLYDYQTENAGKSHLYGFELETNYQPSAAWGVYGSVGYSRTEFDDFQVMNGAASVDLSGSEFAFAPRWTVAIGGDYRWTNGLALNLNASYRSDMYGATGVTQGQTRIDERILVNGKFGYNAEHWSLSVFANNVFDETYIQYEDAARNRAVYGAPRVIGAILETRW